MKAAEWRDVDPDRGTYDNTENIACVVAGTRRFTMFPPDQIGDLYV